MLPSSDWPLLSLFFYEPTNHEPTKSLFAEYVTGPSTKVAAVVFGRLEAVAEPKRFIAIVRWQHVTQIFHHHVPSTKKKPSLSLHLCAINSYAIGFENFDKFSECILKLNLIPP